MKQIIRQFALLLAWMAFSANIQPAHAVNYGDYNLYAHFNFENGANDLMDNVAATGFNLTYEYDSDLGMNVMGFQAGNQGYLKLDTNPVEDEMTVSLWFKRQDIDETACWRMIFSWYAPDGSNIYLTPRTSWGTETFLIAENRQFTDYKTLTMKTITKDVWTHFAIVFDNTNILAYQDGVLVGNAKIIGGAKSFGTTKHYFGNNPDNGYTMSGKIGDIRIYHSVLSANQIQALYNKEDVPPPAPLDDADAPYAQICFDGTVYDSKGNVDFESNVLCTTSADHRMSGLFGADSYISTTENPVGNDKYTLAMLYRPEQTEESQTADKVIFKFASANGDYVALFSRNVEGKLQVECENSVSGTVKKIGVVSNEIIPATWNSIVFAQSYAASGKGIGRIYINGTLCKSFLGFSTKDVVPVNWSIGEQGGNALVGNYADIRFYQRELSTTEVATYHSGNTNSISLSVNLNDEKQTIRNFGASDGWNGQTVGLYFTEKQQAEIAELLFSQDFDENGNPKGIGLSSWRFNIGAGTSEQGAASRITDETRRTECFLNADGSTYDWDKQAGQQALLYLATKTYGVDQIIGWQNSPPVMFTKRGLGFREYGDPMSTILKQEHYTDYGNFLADVIEHFEDEGIHFDYISPLNEPQFEWTCDATTRQASQEGSPWSNQEIHDVVTAINTVFSERGITSKLFLSEAANIAYQLSTSSGFATQQLDAFWGNGSQKISDLECVAPIVSSHSYWTDGSAEAIVDNRIALKNEMSAKNHDLEYWQTEYSLLGYGYQFGHPSGQLSPIQCAISLARIIHADLVLANATGWQWWTTFELEKNITTEDRFCLIRIAVNTDKTAGVYNTTKLMYGMGNYSFFVRPGMKRIGLSRSDNMNDYEAVTKQMFSAYKDDETGRIVIVAINASADDCGISLPEITLTENQIINTYIPYVTSGNDGDELKRYNEIHAGQHYVMLGYSIITFVADPKDEGGTVGTNQSMEDKLKVSPTIVGNVVYINAAQNIKDILIYDLSGRLMKAVIVNDQNTCLDVSNLAEGVYLLQLGIANGIVTKRIIVSR